LAGVLLQISVELSITIPGKGSVFGRLKHSNVLPR